MADPRITKLASLLINYSLEIKPGQQLVIVSNLLAEELLVEVYAEAIRAGAHVFLWSELPQGWELFYKYASGAQLDYVSPINRLLAESFDARLHIEAAQNTRALSGIDPTKMARRAKAQQPVNQIFFERAARKELRWCSTLYPTHASAQEADMSLLDYREFVFAAGKLDEPDPVASWRVEERRQAELIGWLDGKNEVALKGADIDLRLSIQGRRFEPSDGKYNFPDGEIFTGPVESSANGWVRFRYPAIYGGQEVEDVELWFENGRVIREQASKGQELLSSLLNSDAGSRYLGEWGIGTNYSIPRFTKNMLFDEKLGGTIHFAIGASYPETGGQNESGVHWDLLCDMADSEITVDGELFYRNGRPVMWP
ncbi:MAG TPA: aminopeptidase [Ardenticatenaceae bacterium]|nr:aminopeptidase [Ardenticatenaceae bacterium]